MELFLNAVINQAGTAQTARLSEARTSRFAPYVVVGTTLALITGLQWHTVRSLLSAWESKTYSHGYFIVPVSLYLIWARRQYLATARIEPLRLALVGAFACALVGVMGMAGDVH